MSATGIIDLASKHSVTETVDRLEGLLKAKGIKVFARIDQAAEAKAAGLMMRPMVLVIFGDPKAGTPLMNRHPSLAMDRREAGARPQRFTRFCGRPAPRD